MKSLLDSISSRMRNIEIKARITDYEKICKIAEELSGRAATLIRQDDTFYNGVNRGRLKMRFSDDSSGTLVQYDRGEEDGPKLTDYELLEFPAGERHKAKRLHRMLSNCLGIRGRVLKERKLYMVDQTKVHIDTVQHLGNFIEFEVILQPEQSVADGRRIASDLMAIFGVSDEDLIDCAYIDMLDK